MNSWRNMNLKPLGAKAPGRLISIAHWLKPMAIWFEAHGNLVEVHGTSLVPSGSANPIF